MQVSRETDEPSQEVLSELFAARASVIKHYVDILLSRGIDHGLIGPRETERIWQRHILNCASISNAFPDQARIADVGSGAGLPGIVLAVARPDLSIDLIEPLLRRSEFLTGVVDDLGLSTVTVRRTRAEDAGERQYDAVTARAVAPLARLARWSLPLVRSGGHLVAMKGSSAAVEITEAAQTLRDLHAGAVLIESYTAPGLETPTTVVRIESSGERGRTRKQRKV